MKRTRKGVALLFLSLIVSAQPLFAMPKARAQKNTGCFTKCEKFYADCVNKKIGPKGGWSSEACWNGRAACRRTCR